MLPSAKTAEQLTLAEACDLILYGANCDRCYETRRVNLAQLRDRLGPQFLLGDVRPRLHCSNCGNAAGDTAEAMLALWLSRLPHQLLQQR